MSAFEGTNPQDLITEDWDITDWSFQWSLVEDVVKTLAYNMKTENCYILSLDIQ